MPFYRKPTKHRMIKVHGDVIPQIDRLLCRKFAHCFTLFKFKKFKKVHFNLQRRLELFSFRALVVASSLDLKHRMNSFLIARRGVSRMQKLSPPSLVGTRRYQRFPLSQACSSSEYSFACCACLQGFYLPSFPPAHSTSFSPNFFNHQQRNVHVLNSQSECFLVVEIPLFRTDMTLRG